MEQKLNAVICVLNSKFIHSSLAPWCLLAGVKEYCEEGINAEVVEGTINENLNDIKNRILALNPRLVGFSCYIWNISAVKQLANMVKSELPGVVIVFGGPEVSYNSAEILKEEPSVNYVLSGEGEKPFAHLLNALFHGNGINDIPGLSFRIGYEIKINRPEIFADDPPSPYSEKYLGALRGRIAYLETSRGCPYACSFCLSGYSKVRYFNIERAKRDLLLLSNSGTQTVKLVDRTFNANRERAKELIRFILDNYGTAIPTGICFHFEIAGDILDDETISLLQSAPSGSIQVEIGIQSFNAETLAAVNRRTDVERLKSNIKRLLENCNIHVHVDLIAGLPYEGIESFAGSFNKAYDLKPHMLQLGFLKLLRGSEMQNDHFGSFNNSAPYEVQETPWLSSEELRYLHHTEEALDRLYNSGRFRRTLQYVLRQTGETPFELFSGFGSSNKNVNGISLEDYITLTFEYFSAKTGVDKSALRDAMVCDYLASNSSGKLPKALRIEDPALRKLKKTYGPGKALRGLAILYTESCAVYADYSQQDPVSGEYPLTKIYI